MKDFVILVIEIHLVLSVSLIFTLIILAVKKFGIKKIIQDLKHDIDFWFVIIMCLISPYQVVLIGFGKTGKEIIKILDKVKRITMNQGEEQ